MDLGFQDDGRLRDGQDWASLDQGRALGARNLRIILTRDRLKQYGGREDLSAYDAIIDNARQRGIAPQIVLDNRTGSGMGDPKKYEAFVKTMAKHFKGRVGTYSLENEPDLSMSPEKYRQLYVRGQKALNQADHGARVLFGEFSPHDPVGYAKKVLAKGGLHASGVAWHPYQTTDPLAPSAHDIQAGTKGGIGRLGTLLKQFGQLNLKTKLGHTPGAYLTEFGYGDRGFAAGTTDHAPEWWPRALQKARNAGVKQLNAYTMTGSDSPTWDTGLLNPDGTARPAYDALAAAVKAGILAKKG